MMNMTPMKYRGPDVHEPKTKTALRIILKPYPDVPAVSYAAPEKREPHTQFDMTDALGNTA